MCAFRRSIECLSEQSQRIKHLLKYETMFTILNCTVHRHITTVVCHCKRNILHFFLCSTSPPYNFHFCLLISGWKRSENNKWTDMKASDPTNTFKGLVLPCYSTFSVCPRHFGRVHKTLCYSIALKWLFFALFCVVRSHYRIFITVFFIIFCCYSLFLSFVSSFFVNVVHRTSFRSHLLHTRNELFFHSP